MSPSTGTRFGDMAPYVYRTRNYGATWEPLDHAGDCEVCAAMPTS